ncbi:MAG: YbhB/YbcL family Raf kinase inhibitor-like protein [Chitinophagales bacterium]|nr:YbhB/YbcL family Raf kinase inhibitor-like protein [Chitinophagales bacterium]
MIASLKIASEAFKHNSFIPSKFTCDGENINPSLIISGLPMHTKTLVLIMEDLDGPKGSVVHWILWNIPPTNKILANSVPGEAGINDFRKRKYQGPCPTSGVHRYAFKVYALDNFLHLDSKATRADLQPLLDDHAIGFGEIIGLYKRRNS